MILKNISVYDKEKIKKCIKDVFSKDPWNDRWEEEILDRYVLDLITPQNSLGVGYFDGGELIAVALGRTIHWWQGKEYKIDEFLVADRYQHQGIGHAFMQTLSAALKENGYKAIVLSTRIDVSAYEFYIKNGFVRLDGMVELSKWLP